MIRATIYLPEDLKAALEMRAEADGRRESDIIRDALSEVLLGTGRTAQDMRFGMFDSGSSNTSVDVDEILAESG